MRANDSTMLPLTGAAAPVVPVPACQARVVQGSVWMTPSRDTKAWTHLSTPDLFQLRRKTWGLG